MLASRDEGRLPEHMPAAQEAFVLKVKPKRSPMKKKTPPSDFLGGLAADVHELQSQYRSLVEYCGELRGELTAALLRIKALEQTEEDLYRKSVL